MSQKQQSLGPGALQREKQFSLNFRRCWLVFLYPDSRDGSRSGRSGGARARGVRALVPQRLSSRPHSPRGPGSGGPHLRAWLGRSRGRAARSSHGGAGRGSGGFARRGAEERVSGFARRSRAWLGRETPGRGIASRSVARARGASSTLLATTSSGALVLRGGLWGSGRCRRNPVRGPRIRRPSG